MTTSIQPQRLFTLLIFLGLSTYYSFSWHSVRSELSDFLPFYTAAILLQRESNPYDIEAQCQIQQTIRTDLCMPFNHTPLLLPLISLVSNGDYSASYSRWSGLLYLVILLSVVPAYYLSNSLDSSLQAILFVPLFISITQGQDTAFIVLGIFVWALLRMKKDFWAGLALTLAVVKPHIALLLAVPLLFSRPKAFLGFFVGSLVITMIGLFLVGFQGFYGLIEITRISARGEAFGINQFDMYSITGLLARAGLNPFWVWPVFGVMFLIMSLVWQKYGTSIEMLSLGVISTTIAAPHLLFHDLAIIILPLYLIHPYSTVLASLVLLSSRSVGIPYVGAYVVMITVAVLHIRRLVKKRRTLILQKALNVL